MRSVTFIMSTRHVIALFQGESKNGDVSHNIAKMEEQMRLAKRAGAVLVVFPELFLTGYTLPSEVMRKVAEEKQGPSFQQLSAAARDVGIAVVYGYPEVERSSGTSTYYNSAQLIDRDGQSLVNYHKTHLWIDSRGYETVFTAGEELSEVVECCGMKIGLLICFDVDFLEAVRVLALRGAKLVLVPTASVEANEGLKTPKTIIPARSMENRIHVAYVNHSGGAFCGHSVCCDPSGTTLVSAENSETLLTAVIDLGHKPSYEYLNCRRPSLYDELC